MIVVEESHKSQMLIAQFNTDCIRQMQMQCAQANPEDINVCVLSALNSFPAQKAAFMPFYESKPEINGDYWL